MEGIGMSPLRVTEHSPAYWTATFDAPPLNLFGPDTHAALRRLLDRIKVFLQLAATPATQARITKAFELGIQQPGSFESDMGTCLAALAPEPDR
jgi:hypothetical protein